MDQAHDIISRLELISAGASFYAAWPEQVDQPILGSTGAQLKFENLYQYLVEISHFGLAAKIHTRRGVHCFDSNNGIRDLRCQLATALQDCDPTASEALMMPWSPDNNTNWPSPTWAVSHGLKVNALLYAAAQQHEVHAVQMYMRAGADPLCKTYLGDCAARIGIANGMLVLFDRPAWMDSRNDSNGETGLFTLARNRFISDLKHAYYNGADPAVKNTSGKTVLDLLDGRFEREILEVIAKAEANALQAGTMPAREEIHRPDLRRRL